MEEYYTSNIYELRNYLQWSFQRTVIHYCFAFLHPYLLHRILYKTTIGTLSWLIWQKLPKTEAQIQSMVPLHWSIATFLRLCCYYWARNLEKTTKSNDIWSHLIVGTRIRQIYWAKELLNLLKTFGSSLVSKFQLRYCICQKYLKNAYFDIFVQFLVPNACIVHMSCYQSRY